MSRTYASYFLILASAAVFAGGCAKQELIKKDETIPTASQATPAKTAPATPSAQDSAPQKKEPISDTTLSDAKAQEWKGDAQAAAGMDTVFFDLDSYTLSPAARTTLVKNAGVMKKKGGVKVRIEGHCDERGSDEYNLALGEKRAKAALNYLVTLGVPAAKLSVISYGKEKPADPGHGETAWAKNRRDEFVIVSN